MLPRVSGGHGLLHRSQRHPDNHILAAFCQPMASPSHSPITALILPQNTALFNLRPCVRKAAGIFRLRRGSGRRAENSRLAAGTELML